MNRIQTGIISFDNLLNGGFPEGATIIIAGRPGTGKTILAHQIIFNNVARGFTGIYLTTLGEPQIKVMRFQQNFTFFDHEQIQHSFIYREMGSILRKDGYGQLLGKIDELLKEFSPRLIAIDTIKTITDMIPSTIEFRKFLLDLSLRMSTWGCTSLLLGEYSEEDIEKRPESAIADGIIFLYGTEEIKQQKRFLRILKMRGTGYKGGANLFRITENGIEVFPRLESKVSQEIFGIQKERVSTGIFQLDKMMKGGIPRYSTTLLSGSSGTGKTILATHFAYAGLCAGEKVLYATFEETPQQIVDGALQLGLNMQQYLDLGFFTNAAYLSNRT